MSRTPRTDQQKGKDRNQLADKAKAGAQKINEAEIKGESFWCARQEQRIGGPVCQKIQSTQGCKIGLFDEVNNL